MPLLALVFAALLAHQGQPLLTLEIRAFRGSDDVTGTTRITVHRAGERAQPVAQLPIGGGRTVKVPAGIYDAQAVQEQDGQVISIRWAERLVVMAYPDEAGHHLEVVNFTAGYGALQLRSPSGGKPDSEVAVFLSGERRQAVPPAGVHPAYELFVLPVGQYDLRVRRVSRATWHTGIDVPLDRTRLWIVP